MFLHAICFVLIVVTPPAFSGTGTFCFYNSQIICFIRSLRTDAAIWAVGVTAGFIQPFIAGNTSP